MAKTKFFRVAVEGPTVDGRNIDRDWIDQMAANYDPKTYTARINIEHIAGFTPDPPFNAYGDVVALRATDVELQIDGKPKKLRALEAQFDVNDQAIDVNKKDQKVFTSCEVAPNFAGSGKAGLVGMAMTDTPASLGTERLQFSAKIHGTALSAAHETTIEFEQPAPAPGQDSDVTSLAKGIAAFFTNFGKTKEEPEQPVPPPPPAPANDNLAAFAAEVGKMAGVVEQLSGKFDGFGTRLDAAEQAHTDLAAKLEAAPSGTQAKRTLSTGGDGSGRIKTDC
jgi:hypothetical protein